MSNQNPMFGQFGKQAGRITPEGVSPQANNSNVSSNVPFVPAVAAPYQVAPQLNLFNQLAQSLGSGGLGLQASMRNAKAAADKRAEREQTEQYSKGVVDAASRAAKTRDIYTDLTTNGYLPANKHPYYKKGLEMGLSQSLASQYRNEVHQARLSKPLASPEEVQDSIKGKYLEAIQGMSPEVVAEFFIKPSLVADDDDRKTFDAEDSKRMLTEGVQTYSTGLSSLLQTEAERLLAGKTKPEDAALLIAEQANINFTTNYAMDIPMNRYLDSTVDAVEVAASNLTHADGTPGTLKEKEALLRSLTLIKDPSTGQPFMVTNLDYAKKVAKLRDTIRLDSAKLDKEKADLSIAQREADTGKLTDVLIADVVAGKVKDQREYTKIAKDMGLAFDPSRFNSIYSSYNSQNRNTSEVKKDSINLQILTDVENGASPTEIAQKYGPLANAGLINPNQVWEGVQTAHRKADHEDNAKKSSKIPESALTPFLHTIKPKLGFARSYVQYTNYSHDTVQQAVEGDLRLKYGQIFRSNIAKWREANPQAGEVEIQNGLVSEWQKLQPALLRDIDRIAAKEGNYRDIVNLGSVSKPKPKPKPISPTDYSKKYGWALNPQANKIEQELFVQKRGRKYATLVEILKKNNKMERLDYYWKKYSNDPEALVRILQNSGRPTYLNQPKATKPKTGGPRNGN